MFKAGSPSGETPITKRRTPRGVRSQSSMSNIANLTAGDYGRLALTSGRSTTRGALPSRGFTNVAASPSQRGATTPGGSTPVNTGSPSLASGNNSLQHGKLTRSRAPTGENSSHRVFSHSPSSQSLPVSAPPTSKSLARPLAGMIFDPAAQAVLEAAEEPQEERPKSPPLLLSVAPSEDNLDPNAPPPKSYTVAEFLNLILKHDIDLPDDDTSSIKVRATGIQGSDIELKESPSMPLFTEELVVEMKKRKDQVDVMKRELLSPKPLSAAAKSKGKDQGKGAPQKLNFMHPDGTLFTPEEIQASVKQEQVDNECAKSPSGRKRFLVPVYDYNQHGTREGKEQIEAEWKQVERDIQTGAVKLPNFSDSVIPRRDWANEDWQTAVMGPEWVKRQKEKWANDPKTIKIMERRAARLALLNPKGWYEGKPAATTFHNFLELPDDVMKQFMTMVLVVYPEEETVPYHYVEGKIIKNADGSRGGLRTKPQVDVLVALCASKHKKVRKALDIARNTLYRENRFAFRKPSELIMFLNAIGWINMARMDFKENLAVSSNFFSKYKHSLELKWMARWHPELRSAMKGITLFTPDWDPKDFDEDYKPPEIEMALKTMILVMEEIEQLNQALNKPHMSPRFKTMDLTECFITIASQLQSLGMGDMSQSEVGEYTSELAGVDEEGNLLEVKDKGKGKEKEIDPVEGHNGHTEVGWGYWTLDAASGSQGFFERFYENDNGDTRSEDSGYYTPSIHVENDQAACYEDENLYGISGQGDAARFDEDYDVSEEGNAGQAARFDEDYYVSDQEGHAQGATQFDEDYDVSDQEGGAGGVMLFDEDYDVSDQEGGNVSDSTSENSKLEREVMEMFKQVGSSK